MKYLVISDIHGSRSAAEVFEAAYRIHQPDAILCLGDILYHGPRNPLPDEHDPKGVCAILNSYADRILAVRGNCEAEVDSLMLEFPVSADYSSFMLGNRRVFMTHGHIYGPDRIPVLRKGDILLSGHTHIPLAEERDGIVILNPGSLALPKNSFPRSYGVLDDQGFQIYSTEHEPFMQYVFG